MTKPIIVLGPTAIGKTAIAVRLAKIIDAQIISADSVQIYRYMDIGSAKPTQSEKEGVVHHLIDIKFPDEIFSSGEFVKSVNDIMKRLKSENKNAIIVGGGGFYIDSLIFGIDEIGAVNENIKRFFDDVCEEMSPAHLYKLLKIVDEKWAYSVKEQDCQRIKRGLSVYFDKHKELSSFFSSNKKSMQDKFYIFVLYADRKFINNRIEKRVDKMIESGLIDEVKKLVEMGYAETNALKSIGYKEILSYLAGEIDKETAVDLIKKNTKAYAKRQMTLLRSRFKDATWIDVEKNDPLETILDVCRPSP